MRPLTDQEVWDFFDSPAGVDGAVAPGWGALTTIGPDGFPHTVAIGFFRLDKTIYCGCRDGTQKVRNVDREPRTSLMLESGRGQSSVLRGVTFQALASVIRDPRELLEIKRRLSRLRGEPEPSQVAAGIAYICLRPVRVLSWTN